MAPVHTTQAQMQTPLEEELSDTSLLWLEAGAGLFDVVKGLFMVQSELYWVWGPNSKYKLHVILIWRLHGKTGLLDHIRISVFLSLLVK